MTLRLYQFAPALGLPNASPFCMKVETYLRLAGIDYRCVNGASPLRAPRRKLPWIDDSGTRVSDSSFIVRHLESTRGAPLDGGLSDAERSAGHAIQRMLEESTYFAVLYFRWIDAVGWPRTRDAFFGKLPGPIAAAFGALVRRKLRRDLAGQGTGLHTPEEIVEIGRADLDALATRLEGGEYVLGARMSSYDAVAIAFLANVLRAPAPSPLQQHAIARPALRDYCDRMMARVYPEFTRP